MSTMIRTQTSITLTEAQQYSALYWITIEQVIDFLVMKGNTNSCGLLTSGSSDIIVVLKKGIQMCFNYFRFVGSIFSNKYVAHSESFQCSCSFFYENVPVTCHTDFSSSKLTGSICLLCPL